MSDSRCKLLLVIPTLSGGGAERVITTLLRHFDRSVFELTLAVVDLRDPVFRSEVPQDISVVDLASARVRFALPSVVRLIRATRPDVVLSTLGHLNLALAMLRPFLPRHVHLVGRETMVMSDGLAEYAMPRAWKILYRVLCGTLDHVICQSQDMRDDLERNFGVPAERMTVIHNPVDLPAIKRQLGGARAPRNRQAGSIELVAAGRLVHQKGYDLLIEAIALCRDIPLRLTILGEGGSRDALESLARERGVADRVRFAGFQRNPYPFLADADAVVLSSRYEGLPNVVLEALACGTPVIATPAPGGARELLEGVDACELAVEVSAPALADAIRRWAARRPAALPPGLVERFAAERIAKAYESTLLRVAGR